MSKSLICRMFLRWLFIIYSELFGYSYLDIVLTDRSSEHLYFVFRRKGETNHMSITSEASCPRKFYTEHISWSVVNVVG